MKKELVKYIEELPHGLGIRVWLHLFAHSASNGTAIINYKELASLYQTDVTTIKKAFDYKGAVKRGLVKLRTETESTAVISFRKNDESVKSEKKPQKVPRGKKEKKVQKLPMLPKKKELPIVTTGLPVIQSDMPSLQLQAERIYTEDVKRDVIYDYCQFYKSLQASIAITAGIPIEHIKPANPDITGRDVKAFKEIAQYFIRIGCTNGDMIKRSFLKIYGNWENFDGFIQNGFTPPEIKFNLNKIMLQIKKHALNQTDGTIKKQNELQKQFNRREAKDYSFLENK